MPFFPGIHTKNQRLNLVLVSSIVRVFGWKTAKYRREFMTHEDVWRAIENFATEHHMSCSGLAKCSGLDPTTFNKSKRWSKEGQPRWPSTNSISKILASTGASLEDFTKFIPSNEQHTM